MTFKEFEDRVVLNTLLFQNFISVKRLAIERKKNTARVHGKIMTKLSVFV
jgi:hypothetical protein